MTTAMDRVLDMTVREVAQIGKTKDPIPEDSPNGLIANTLGEAVSRGVLAVVEDHEGSREDESND